MPPRVSPEKPRIPSHLSPHRTVSNSSSSTIATSSPTVKGVVASKLFSMSNNPLSQTLQKRGHSSQIEMSVAKASPFKVPQKPSENPNQASCSSILRTRPSLDILKVGMSEASKEEKQGKFEREFIEIAEVGSGEFGKVMKVRHQEKDGEVWAVKKSKRFEGGRHR